MVKRSIISAFLILLFNGLISSQTLYNNGRDIMLTPGAIVSINGGLTNQNGTLNISNDNLLNAELNILGNLVNNDDINCQGIINISGNWINNSVFSSTVGTVNLESASPTLGGTEETYFNNLSLNVAGTKTLLNSQHINGILSLNESEIKTESFSLFIETSNPAAVVYSTGFVSSDEDGFMSRKMQTISEYVFPVGADFSNPIVRPIIISPSSLEISQFNVRFVNANPDDEGYYISLLEDSIDDINDNFYHIVNKVQGNAAVEMNILYEPEDGDFDHLANWRTSPSPSWYLMDDSFNEEESAYNLMTEESLTDFSKPVFILCKKTEVDNPIDSIPNPEEIIIYNSFSPNGDNYNDQWVVDNCLDCQVKIYNRNGNMVFESPDNTISWDGKFKSERVPDATYYYVIDRGDGFEILKGSVTLIR
jgi:gliding motility-associated-like protein